MGYRGQEKTRLRPLKTQLFSPAACAYGQYRGAPRPFCLHETRSEENLYQWIRAQARSHFKSKGIHWHDGVNGGPRSHLCCSQSFCVNTLFPYNLNHLDLAAVLRGIG